MSLRLQDVVHLDQEYPQLSFNQVQQFILLASKLKDDILLAQPSSTGILAFDPPDIISPTITMFLQHACQISADCVDACWNALKYTIWNDANDLEDSTIHDFEAHGHSLGLCTLQLEHFFGLQVSQELMGLVDSRTLYPPQHTCTNPSCERSQSGHLLKKEEQRQAVLYTFDKGAIPVRSVHLYCDSEFVP
jgi:hypothetical protein